MRIIEKEAEAHLIELLNLVRDNRQGWQGLCFGFSRLLPHYRNEYQIKIATNLMNDLLGDLDGAIYLCDDATIYIMVRHFSPMIFDKMVFQLRYLFMDDPLSYTPEGDENPEFVTRFDIETQWDEFIAICKRRLVLRVRQSRITQTERKADGSRHSAVLTTGAVMTTLQPLEPGHLTGIARSLREIDISATMRRQPICASLPGTAVRTVFDEMYVNILHLRQVLALEVDFHSDRNLFQYLTRQLDLRVLDTIQKVPSKHLINPVSLNLNIETLLSTRFVEFDAAVKPGTKVSIVIELQIGEVFADMVAFNTAKEVVQRLGYRICLDGTSELSFPQIDRQSMGVDLVKLIWNADRKSEIGSVANQRLMDAVKRCGANRVILTRCDTKEAVEFGQALGITLFQGRYLDGLLNPRATVVN